MSSKSSVVTVRCLPFRECLSFANIKSKLRGFVYEYETPKIVTIHSVSSKLNSFGTYKQLEFVRNQNWKYECSEEAFVCLFDF